MIRSRFTHELVDGALVVIDRGGQLCMSVTNDIENVVEAMARAYPDVDLDRIPFVYRDTMGAWDGVLVRDGRFADFVLLNAASEREAISGLKKWSALYA